MASKIVKKLVILIVRTNLTKKFSRARKNTGKVIFDHDDIFSNSNEYVQPEVIEL